MIKIRKTPEFEEWLAGLRLKEQAQILARLHRIEVHDHLGDWKPLEGTDHMICELRWKNGWRVYFYREGIHAIYLLWGGMKNDQKQDIKKTKILFRRSSHY